MRFQILFFTAILALTIVLAGCSTAPTVNNTTNIKTNMANSNVSTTNSTNPLETTKKTETAASNNAPTIAPVVQNYYDALKKKDDGALRKIYSQAALKSLEADMKEEKKTSLVAFITELEPAPDKPFEIRNEKIEGDTAIAEIKGGSYGVWTPIKFVKENGEWKMTNESPDFESVKQSASNSNTGK